MNTLPPGVIPAKPPRHRKRKSVPASSAPAPLVLVSAVYDAGAGVTLTFDRAVEIGAMDAGAITVNDGAIMGFVYEGVVASPSGPAMVVVDLGGVEESSDPVTQLTATAANGIVAADDGGAWAGVTDLELPFP
jgi:hypothetical protein